MQTGQPQSFQHINLLRWLDMESTLSKLATQKFLVSLAPLAVGKLQGYKYNFIEKIFKI
jgi:hypothetical protein